MNAYKYDVAISCLSQDEETGQRLHDLLVPRGMSVFFYVEGQTDLVARDGLETFHEVFRRQSRVVVVLYREGWGKTNWTRVEEDAIKDMCLDAGWQRIVLYSLDGAHPKWLPETYIWGREQERWGPAGLAAVIERKVTELGGTPHEEDPVSAAERARRAIEAHEAREKVKRSTEGAQKVIQELEALESRLREIAEDASHETMPVNVSNLEYRRFIHTGLVAVVCEWSGLARNTAEGCVLEVYQADRVRRVDPPVGRRAIGKYEPELREDGRWMWVEKGNHQIFSSHDLADLMARHLVEEHLRRKTAPPKRPTAW